MASITTIMQYLFGIVFGFVFVPTLRAMCNQCIEEREQRHSPGRWRHE